MPDNICPSCGADKENYKEAMGESCGCAGTNMDNQKVFRVLNLLRRNGVNCFQVDGVTTKELDAEVRGYG